MRCPELIWSMLLSAAYFRTSAFGNLMKIISKGLTKILMLLMWLKFSLTLFKILTDWKGLIRKNTLILLLRKKLKKDLKMEMRCCR